MKKTILVTIIVLSALSSHTKASDGDVKEKTAKFLSSINHLCVVDHMLGFDKNGDPINYQGDITKEFKYHLTTTAKSAVTFSESEATIEIVSKTNEIINTRNLTCSSYLRNYAPHIEHLRYVNCLETSRIARAAVWWMRKDGMFIHIDRLGPRLNSIYKGQCHPLPR